LKVGGAFFVTTPDPPEDLLHNMASHVVGRWVRWRNRDGIGYNGSLTEVSYDPDDIIPVASKVRGHVGEPLPGFQSGGPTSLRIDVSTFDVVRELSLTELNAIWVAGDLVDYILPA
jgi:hypothetical protein